MKNFYLETEKQKTAFVNLRLEKALFLKLKNKADEEGCSNLSEFIRERLRERLDEETEEK